MSNFWDADPVAEPSRIAALTAPPPNGGKFWESDPVAEPAKEHPISVNNVARSAATGFPIVGGLLNKANAATNAALAPVLNPLFDKKDQLGESTYAERYAHSLRDQEAMDKGFAEQHPIVDTAAKLVGGTAAMVPAMSAAPAVFGLTGPLDVMVARGAASGAALNAADAAVRGEDPLAAASIGGLVGGAAGPAGKLVGKTVSAIGDRINPAPLVPTRTIDVNGVRVPVRESVITGSPDTSGEEQVILRGGRGAQAQETATSLEDQSKAAMSQAHAELAAGLDPAGANPRLAPEDAGHMVASELASQEQQRAAVEAQRLQAATNERNQLRAGIDQPGATAAPDTPHAMGEAISAGIRGRAQSAAAARTAAYDAVGQVEGEFSPSVFSRAGNAIRDRLNGGADPVRITDRLTPNAADALRVVDEDLGHLRFEDQTRRGELTLGADGRPVDRPITGADVEATRKKLVQLQRSANSSARAPGGSYEDARAMRRMVDEFDNHVRRGIEAGGFSGNGEEYLARLANARQLHAQYRQNFSSQGAGDKVGQAIENIIGKHAGQEATPDTIVKAILGSANEPGGGQTVQIAQRLRSMFGENSPEWAAVRKAMVSHLTEAPAGAGPLAHDVQADRILNFLGGTKGRTLSQVLFSPSERASLSSYANRLRNVADPQPANQVERIIAHISGRDGLPSSSTDVVNRLFDTKGNNAVSVQLARQLHQQLSPESWNAVRQGMWSKLTEPAEGMIAWGPQKISQNIHNFLKSDIAEAMFSDRERGLMKTIASAHGQMVPVPGTTNPSGTAPMLAKIAGGARHTLLPLLGFTHGGMSGAAVGLAADKALTWVGNKRAADTARKFFYGEQAKRPINPVYSRAARIIAQSALTQSNQNPDRP